MVKIPELIEKFNRQIEKFNSVLVKCVCVGLLRVRRLRVQELERGAPVADGAGTGQLLHTLAEKRCKDFGTCENGVEGAAKVN